MLSRLECREQIEADGLSLALLKEMDVMEEDDNRYDDRRRPIINFMLRNNEESVVRVHMSIASIHAIFQSSNDY
jgi:hypothetical protein